VQTTLERLKKTLENPRSTIVSIKEHVIQFSPHNQKYHCVDYKLEKKQISKAIDIIQSTKRSKIYAAKIGPLIPPTAVIVR